MAIYYLNAQIIGRSAGRTSTGAAAYRAGERIHDERTGETFDYSRRRGEIETEILATAGSPAWVRDRSQLWNQVEKMERRGDAQLARELVVAIPIELDRAQQRQLVRDYVQQQFVGRGMVADVAFHWVDKNPHAHIMLTMREMRPEGFSSKKNREWNKPELLQQWREQWAVEANRALEKAGREERIDHRSLSEQGSDRLPQVHLGPHSAALQRRGIATEKGEHNRVVAEHNTVMIDLEKAREERRHIQVQKAVAERYHHRTGGGWLPVHAQALAKLEYSLGGGELTYGETARLVEGYRAERQAMEQQIRTIHHEGNRLERASTVLSNRQDAITHVERLNSPLARGKRVFSQDARKEFTQAQQSLETLDHAARSLGATTEAELQAQRSSWQQQRTQVPALEQKAADLTRVIDLAAKALDGFAQEHEREMDWLAKPKRARDRDSGRDR